MTLRILRELLKVFAVVLGLSSVPAACAGNTFQVLHTFGASGDGAVPSGPLAIDGRGNLYGMTDSGGTGTRCSDNGCGVIFELTAQGNNEWAENILFDFTTDTGGSTSTALVFDGAGNLFGGTFADIGGGSAFVFELTPGNGGQWNFVPIYTGAGACLTFDRAGNLYGAIGPGDYFGAGAIGELTPATGDWIYAQLYSFCSLPRCADGYDTKWPLSWDTEGNLYGATYFGGYGYGLAFELIRTPSAAVPQGIWRYQIMHRFGAFPTDGGYPGSGLVLDRAGNAYGVSYNGGPYGEGAVYELTRSEAAPWVWRETQLYGFPTFQTGAFPVGNLVFDQAGNLYGSAGGGSGCNGFGCGVIFKLTPGANGQWSYSVLHYFDGQDGFGPNPLAIDGNGNLFGTTSNGGTYNEGVAFEITP